MPFQEHLARQRKRWYVRYVYARQTVPPQATGIVLRQGDQWWFVTPAFPYENAAWRVSYGDEHGPAGHHTDTGYGPYRPFWTKYDAILDVLIGHKRARITEYALPSGEHVLVGRRGAQANIGRIDRRRRG